MIIHFHFHPLPILLTYLTIIPQTISIAIPQSPSNINTITNSHPNLGSWHALPPIPISPRKEHATVYLEPYIYILGGVTPTNDPTHPFEPTTLTQRYSLETNTWSTVAPLPLPLTHPNAAVINGAIYLLGGLTPSSPLNPTLLTTAPNSYIYHPETNIWSPLSLDIPPSLQVAAAATASRGNSIYLAGGLTHFNLNISSPSPPTPKITNSLHSLHIRSRTPNLASSTPAIGGIVPASGFLEDIGLFFCDWWEGER
ncbi:hypothetical protein SS1G_03276 [Sclerotinia sclerotiorum 1980 UF-70]|uniref:Galactose oxidase n=1 Tax=Sclerotinia sclerotiorum (strain ATCC 18683 / 1980 / Ss-1) TaxID=665079 RepID=A7ED86_SCLS1|nr:hypothetical protein SS1G_03276 [Sclerotinia sclerotiorum 1980 UF-70]EDO00802.1 hypothetical protein SS1G_03276 [Sclerotinia sclerotiorum 1980 UF-70]